jgi:4a-hydroxytetrahydrobiopterin dehydratase
LFISGSDTGARQGFRRKSGRGRLEPMPRPSKLEDSAVDAFLKTHDGWSRVGDAIARAYTFADFSAALGFVVRVGLAAEKRDHHPDIELGWGKARVLWTTHDAGGISALDLELAERSDSLARG